MARKLRKHDQWPLSHPRGAGRIYLQADEGLTCSSAQRPSERIERCLGKLKTYDSAGEGNRTSCAQIPVRAAERPSASRWMKELEC